MNEILDQPINLNKESKQPLFVKFLAFFTLLRLFASALYSMDISTATINLLVGRFVIPIGDFGMIVSGVVAFGLGLVKKNKRTLSTDIWNTVFIIGAILILIGFISGSLVDERAFLLNMITTFGWLIFTVGALALIINYYDLFKKYPTRLLKYPSLMVLVIISLDILSGFDLVKFNIQLVLLILILIVLVIGLLIKEWFGTTSVCTKIYSSVFAISFALIFVGLLVRYESLPFTFILDMGLISFFSLLTYELLLKDLITKN